MTEFPQRDAAVRAFQKRRSAENRRKSEEALAKTLKRLAAPEPPIDRSKRDPIFAELDAAIEREDEQARRRVRRAAGTE